MFVLRKFSSDNVEINIELGQTYTKVGECCPNELNRVKDILGFEEDPNVVAIITGDGGNPVIPVLKNQLTFIMSDSGATFDCINKVPRS